MAVYQADRCRGLALLGDATADAPAEAPTSARQAYINPHSTIDSGSPSPMIT